MIIFKIFIIGLFIFMSIATILVGLLSKDLYLAIMGFGFFAIIPVILSVINAGTIKTLNRNEDWTKR